jgi:hypothetical protein
VVNSGSGYNENSHELLADSGFGSGIAVGARRPGLATTTASHRAFDDKVSPATTFAASNSSRLQWNCAD